MQQQQPLSKQFNAMVITMAHLNNPLGWDIVSDGEAPSTLEALNSLVQRSARVAVSGENSETSIYACPEHNAAFRAWHDVGHYAIQAPFTLEGEQAVCGWQVRQMFDRYGVSPLTKFWADLIDCEVIGQALYFEAHGVFPPHQRQFTEAFLADEARALAMGPGAAWVNTTSMEG